MKHKKEFEEWWFKTICRECPIAEIHIDVSCAMCEDQARAAWEACENIGNPRRCSSCKYWDNAQNEWGECKTDIEVSTTPGCCDILVHSSFGCKLWEAK